MSAHRELLQAHFPMLFEAPDPQLEKALKGAVAIRFDVGDRAFDPGSNCPGYAFLTEGGIRCQVVSELGRQITLYHVGPGGSCVLTTSCLLSDTPYPAEGIAQAPTRALLLPRAVFRTALDESAALRRHVFQNFAASLSAVMSRLADVVFGDIDARLIRILLSDDHTSIARTHQDLADELGTAREVVSRHLKRLENRGWLTLRRGSIELLKPLELRAFIDAV